MDVAVSVCCGLDCRRFGLFKMDFAVMVCRRFGLSPFRFVAVSACRRFDCTPYKSPPFHTVIRIHLILLSYHAF